MKAQIFTLLLISSSLKVIISEEKIIFAWQIHRHGARAPYRGVVNNTDVYHENWTEIEELTEVGKRMLYLLGVKTRKRYVEKYKLLNEQYNPQEIYIRSTDVNRTIESIESLLQGLYPTGTGPTINKKIENDHNRVFPPNKKYYNEFEKIIETYNLNDGSALPYKMSIEPIHLFYKPKHEFQLYDTDLCIGHKQKYLEQQNSQKIRDLADELNNHFDRLFFDLEGTNNKSFLYDYWTIYKYMDGFVCDDTDSRKFEYLFKNYENFNEDKLDLLRNYSKEYLWLDYSYVNYPEGYDNISIVANSYTMHSIINWMEKSINGYEKNNSNYIKYVIYSAHDASIGALEHFMKYAFNTEVEYSSFAESRYFELYIDENNEYRVRYLKGENSIKKDLTYNEFKSIINDKTWDDNKVADFCQFEKKPIIDKKEDNNSTLSLVFMISLIILNIIILFILLFCALKKK